MDTQLSLWNGTGNPVSDDTRRIAISIRESRRARQLILQVLPPRTVEVVVPRGMKPRTVQSFIHENHEWIRRAGQELLDTYPELRFRPSTIALAAVGETVDVRYLEAGSGKSRYRYESGSLRLHLAANDRDGVQGLLRRWLLRQARARLEPQLMAEAGRTGLTPGRVQIRLQKTRWGSCSSNGTISLNAALLLVPPELVRYLLIHELCHLRHLSHSRRYWQLVARHEPDFRQLDRRLAACWLKMPAWIAFGGAR